MAGEAPREQATTRALDALPAGAWREMYGVHFASRRLANLDHVVVGREGMFVIDSRDWWGEVELDAESLAQVAVTRESTLARLEDAASALTELVPVLETSHVVPVLCFDHDASVSVWVGRVLVCTTASLVDVLVEQPRVFDAGRVDELFNRLAWALATGTYHVAEPHGPSRVAHRRDGRARPRLVQRRRRHAKHVPSTQGRRMTPWVRAALISISCYLVMIPSVAYGAWPGTS